MNNWIARKRNILEQDWICTKLHIHLIIREFGVWIACGAVAMMILATALMMMYSRLVP